MRVTQIQTVQTGPGGWGILAACLAALAGLMVISKVIASAAAAVAAIVMIVFWLAAGLVLVILTAAAAIILHRLHRGQPATPPRAVLQGRPARYIEDETRQALPGQRMHPADIRQLAEEIVREGRRI